MLTFSSLNAYFRYLFELVCINSITIRIERFDLNKHETAIYVIYRLGRQKLAQRLVLTNFTEKYYTYLSGYDRQRITKFLTLQDMLMNLFPVEERNRKTLINYINTAIKNDQLF